MRKIISLLLVLALLLTGCGNSTSSSKISKGNDAASKNTTSSNESVTAGATDTSNDSSTASESVSDNFGQASDVDLSDIDVDITEKMYVAFINEIYINTDDYIGKTIRIEGMSQAYKDENTGITYYYVYRTGPGCCGNDGSMCGFEYTWDGNMPKDNDWIEVIGKLRTYEEDGNTYLTLDTKSVTVMDVRGAETVYQ